MNQELQTILDTFETIPGLKMLQPWASFIFNKDYLKQYEIRRYTNKQRGWMGILASGWAPYWGMDKGELPHFALIGFCKVVNVKQYSSHQEFDADSELHKNPSDLYVENCFAWLIESPIPVEPLYYEHKNNKKRSVILPLIGQHTRCRISTQEIKEKVKFL